MPQDGSRGRCAPMALPIAGSMSLMLWGVAVERGYAAPLWLTFKQAKDLGGQVRCGEKGSLVVYANRINRSETDETSGEEIERAIPFLKSYCVFNAEQVDGLPAHFYAMAAPALSTFERIEAADRFFAATGAEVRHGGNQAYYTVSDDRVQMPPFEAFQDQISYYATLAHELTHWTKHTKRLDRDFGRKSWGDAGYAMEELVAELGAAFLAADLGLEAAPRADHAAYIASWLKVLKERQARDLFGSGPCTARRRISCSRCKRGRLSTGRRARPLEGCSVDTR